MRCTRAFHKGTLQSTPRFSRKMASTALGCQAPSLLGPIRARGGSSQTTRRALSRSRPGVDARARVARGSVFAGDRRSSRKSADVAGFRANGAEVSASDGTAPPPFTRATRPRAIPAPLAEPWAHARICLLHAGCFVCALVGVRVGNKRALTRSHHLHGVFRRPSNDLDGGGGGTTVECRREHRS
jgi:hypothetical protein